jgi:hypothetical protein
MQGALVPSGLTQEARRFRESSQVIDHVLEVFEGNEFREFRERSEYWRGNHTLCRALRLDRSLKDERIQKSE